jgi:transposase-like protein
MPWNARTAVEQRKAFVGEWQLQQESLAELCRKYGISRQTGYKWIQRFESHGLAGLEDLSGAHNMMSPAGQQIPTGISQM